MTKGCIEYYFLLHYEKSQPLIVSVKDKEKVLKLLSTKYCPGYEKGDKDTTWEIAEHYEIAVENGDEELEGTADENERIRRLYFTDSTFTNVHEAVKHLMEMSRS